MVRAPRFAVLLSSVITAMESTAILGTPARRHLVLAPAWRLEGLADAASAP